jgi:myo-inositol-1(or 4)-monophosphatase
MISTERQALIEIMHKARDLVLSSELADISVKSPQDYVTNVDVKLDEFLTKSLAAITPGVPVFSEERPMARCSGPFWIIDPVDGTHNMMAGVPFYAICVALFDAEGARLSAVLDVVPGALYVAERGEGATRDGKILRIEGKPSTLIAVSSGALDAMNERADIYKPLRNMGKIRNLGSQSLQLCYVADGRLGLVLSQEARFWDDAAARLIAEEAGARYRSFADVGAGDFLDMAFSKEPLQSLCGHPGIFDAAVELMLELWPQRVG